MSSDDPKATDAPDTDRGTPTTLTAVETLATGRGRLTVESVATADGWLVDVGIRSDQIRGRVVLSAEEARAVADQLATAAAEAEPATDTE